MTGSTDESLVTYADIVELRYRRQQMIAAADAAAETGGDDDSRRALLEKAIELHPKLDSGEVRQCVEERGLVSVKRAGKLGPVRKTLQNGSYRVCVFLRFGTH